MPKRNFILGALLLAGLVLVLILLRRAPANEEKTSPATEPNLVELGREAQKNVSLEIAEVKEEQIEETVKTTGIVAPDQSRVAQILPLSPGIVRKIHVRLGDRVSVGQPLLLYDNIQLGELIAEHGNLLGGLDKLTTQSDVAKKSLERAEALIKVDAIAQRELELRKAEYEQTLAAVASQRAELGRVREKLRRFGLNDREIDSLGEFLDRGGPITSESLLRAPIGGVITKFDVTLGELLRQDKELFTIVDPTTVWVLADVYEKDVGRVRSAGACHVAVSSDPGSLFTGRVTNVSDFLDPASRSAKVRCVVPNADGRLKLEMFATVEIPVARRRALAVPAAAVQQMDGASVVFVQRDSTHFEKRPIEGGGRDSRWVEVTKGVKAGEKIVASGSFYLKATFLQGQVGEKE